MHLKSQFKVFEEHPNLNYLDNAATTHKPASVVDGMSNYLTKENGSPNRGAHQLSIKSTEVYEGAREKVRKFLGAKSSEEIIFTRNSTESLNIIAASFGNVFIKKGDQIVLTITSHHSNILPWQMVARNTGAKLTYLYSSPEGSISEEELAKIDDTTALVAFPYVSNGLGVIHDVKRLLSVAKKHGAVTVLDGAQAAGHFPINVVDLDVDFFVFSGHKVFGPQGIGVLYGKKSLLDKMPPFLLGGDMIDFVEEQTATFAELPKKFEAGTQNVTGAVGLGLALDYIEGIGLENIQEHEKVLTKYCYDALTKLKFVTLYGPTQMKDRGALITFNVEGIHPHDVASILDSEGIAIRAGHHCCQPLMKYLDIYASCRVSFSVYNSTEDVDGFIKGLMKVREVFGYVD
ncbi:MAG: SufS family cysteine desulfurase [Vallitaleaceae bacterium]|nr:SufS family cysteine desulfurase [Vallitaleaceae bacterium]